MNDIRFFLALRQVVRGRDYLLASGNTVNLQLYEVATEASAKTERKITFKRVSKFKKPIHFLSFFKDRENISARFTPKIGRKLNVKKKNP